MKSLTQFCLTLLICTASVLAAAEGPTEHLVGQ